MCGVFGALGLELDDSVVHSLRHRGPDGHGLERLQCGKQGVVLGHTRLSILDLSPAGHQPMLSRDGRWWVTFNGEIYNHLALRKGLVSQWRGHSDTETLVELIASRGVADTLHKLNGMFAFAALDLQEQKLHLARDPFGIKPLYFYHESQRFAFASERRTLRALGLGVEVDPDGLRQFLSLRYVPSPATLWRGIRRVPPGHHLRLDVKTGGFEELCYIVPNRDRFHGSMDDAVEAYRGELSAAVKRQLLSDVPVGVLLSGGIDSALVAAMAKDAGAELPCFTVGFGEAHKECEIEGAAETARVLGLPFHQVVVQPEQLQASLPDIVRAIEEPLGTTSVMPMWHLVRRARQDVTVVLTGQGSDEPWGGYFRYQVELLRNRLPMPWFWKVGRGLTSCWQSKPEALDRGLRTLVSSDLAKQIFEACSLFPARERILLLGDASEGGALERLNYWLAWLGQEKDISGMERMMRLDARMNLADDLLLYGDKISMAVSLEARVPMLDVQLVDFVESLPIDYRIRWRHGKVVHKKMAERYLPADIVHRPKKGFQVPFSAWSRNEWRPWLEPLLLEGLDGLLVRQGVEQLWRQHLTGQPDRSRQIFALMMLALWRQEHLQ
ncbi:asparagine synthase (glutamine-hydrolyzing) [Geoalkalibacter sp.]|uniref:asparagine synthase (glutamine-hydrolyzing) n=1 Tax=Geoalkalibacter sp. TaxID=3041440 RepID=UPI00272E4009|nr:asparagine synthase (glutamine-hydrolyzing) [Geoalkalibacter sp.]